MKNLFKRKKNKKDKKAQAPNQNQETNSKEKEENSQSPSIQKSISTPKHALTPSLVRNLKPGDTTIEGRSNDYWVEIGATVEPTRYYRSFFADIQSGMTYIGMLNQLYAGDFGEGDLDIALHIEPADSNRILRELARQIAGVESDLYTERSSAKRASLEGEREELLRKQDRVRRNIERPFFASVQATVSANSIEQAKRFSASMIKRFSGQSIYMKSADTKQLDALKKLTPIDNEGEDVFFKGFLKNMESSNLADFFPFGQGGLSHRSGIVIGYDPLGKMLFYDNWHPNVTNYNATIFGRSGSGKSFAVKLIIARGLLNGIRNAIIDTDQQEYKPLVTKLGCPYIELSPKSDFHINIFDVEETVNDSGNKILQVEDSVKAVQAVVFKMIKIIEEKALTGEAKMLIQEMIWQLYEEKGITDDPQSLYTTEPYEDEQGKRIFEKKKKPMPTLSDLYFKMAEEPKLEEQARIIKTFTRQGSSPSQAIFDCQTNVNIKNVPLFAIDLSKLDKDIMKPLGVFAATKWVWETFGQDPTIRKRIIVEEAQEMMDKDNIETAKWLENSFRKARRRNTGMVAITQGFEVFLRLEEGWGILKNASTKLLMRQEPIDIDAVEGKFNLSAGESEFLLSPPKGGGIIKVEDETSIVFIDSTKEEYKMFTTDPNDISGGDKDNAEEKQVG